MADILDTALRLLSYRPRSEAEVRQRLSRRFPPSLVEEAITSLRVRGLLDDATFARFWRQSRERNRPRGASAIRWELLQKGVDREVVEDALCGLDEEENAHRAVSGLVRKMGQADYHTFREKLVGYLRRRGFNPQAVRATVERSWTELTDPAYSHIGRNAHEQQPKDERD